MTAVYITAAAVASTVIILAAIYLYLTAPRLRHPAFPEFSGLFAHRGLFDVESPHLRPENSLAAFSNAVCRGYGIELDLHLSRDGELVVFHDDNLHRVCGINKNISDFTADELHRIKLYSGDQYIPRFSEVTEITAGQVPLIVELKCPPGQQIEPLCRSAAEALEAYGGKYGGAYCVESFNPFVLRWFKKHKPRVFRGQLSCKFSKSGFSPLRFAMQTLMVNVIGRPDFIAYDCRHKNSVGFRVCRKIFRAQTAAWTVRSQKQLQEVSGDFDCFIFEGFIPDVEFRTE